MVEVLSILKTFDNKWEYLSLLCPISLKHAIKLTTDAKSLETLPHASRVGDPQPRVVMRLSQGSFAIR